MPYQINLITEEELIGYQAYLREQQVIESRLFTTLLYWLRQSEIKLEWAFNHKESSFLARVPSNVYDGAGNEHYLFCFKQRFYGLVLESQFQFKLKTEAFTGLMSHEVDELKSKIAMSFKALGEWQKDPLFQSYPIFYEINL
jgi:hypothetical protein